MRWRILFVSCVVLLGLVSAGLAQKKPDEVFLDPEKAGPDFFIQGEYLGEVGKQKHGAQVIADGGGKFTVVFLPGGLPGEGWDSKTRIKAAAQTDDSGAVTFAGSKWTGQIGTGKLSGKNAEGESFTFNRVERKSQTLGAKPPEGAVVLFDGKNADGWNNGKLTEDGLLQCGTTSKQGFTDLKLHLEFRTPFKPTARGQARGNSGVYLHGNRFEVQVLDSFGLDGKNNECGGLYGQAAPSVNMCYPPLKWQTFDIEYRTARFDAGGKQTRDATVTVYHNGVKVHDQVILKARDKAAEEKPGGINLQNHGNPVHYRNIWVVPLGS